MLATYADGTVRDVTLEAFIESGNTEVAEPDKLGLVSVIRRGEAPILARFEGAYTATTITVMGDRSGYEWKDLPANNFVDELGRIAKYLMENWRELVWPADLFAAVVASGWVLRRILYARLRRSAAVHGDAPRSAC